jgi:hypothetical protein
MAYGYGFLPNERHPHLLIIRHSGRTRSFYEASRTDRSSHIHDRVQHILYGMESSCQIQTVPVDGVE